MKKLILSLSLIVTIFSSCSKNDDIVTVTNVSQNPPGPFSNLPFLPVVSGDLLKKATFQDGRTYVYTYNEKKIDRITESGPLARYTTYTYSTDNLITKIQPYNLDGSAISEGSYEFQYPGDGIIKVKNIHLGTYILAQYITETNNYLVIVQLTPTSTTPNAEKQTAEILFSKRSYQIPGTNGDFAKDFREDAYSYSLKYPNQAGDFPLNVKIDYTFDNKYSPFYNVLRMNILSLVHFETGLYHNVTKKKKGGEPEVNYNYTYNANGFPTARISTIASENCTYEYY